jgi:hypothetical protein
MEVWASQKHIKVACGSDMCLASNMTFAGLEQHPFTAGYNLHADEYQMKQRASIALE